LRIKEGVMKKNKKKSQDIGHDEKMRKLIKREEQLLKRLEEDMNAFKRRITNKRRQKVDFENNSIIKDIYPIYQDDTACNKCNGFLNRFLETMKATYGEVLGYDYKNPPFF